ncbi:hypothetical protein BDV98DRAFT_558035 [Pterulicium gracile]|uniref:Nuclear rim protein 1 n=1 Tax=Pterulicium gracile TaxID=1884261 RepID=A0A5C3QZU2_9AGAR|nr:hypothetical protein BDV98DRAFT_558035 [Pterula gracilis]
MDLRRLAQSNAANNTPTKRSTGTGTPSTPASPHLPATPVTPVNRISAGLYRSPASTPSISSSTPFDWKAARSRKPPPFGTLTSAKKGPRPSTAGNAVKKYVRKKGFFEKLSAIPSRIAFEIAVFPNNLPLPTPATSASIIGGGLHLFNLYIRVCQASKVPEKDMGWEDMYRESENRSWFDWTVPATLLLIAGSLLNAIMLFSRIKLYRLHRRADPVSSPNAMFVSAQLDFEPLKPPSLSSRIGSGIWGAFVGAWRWLLGTGDAASKPARTYQVQQIQMWAPGPLELALFCVYSPVHTLLWLATSTSNWILLVLIMVLVSVQLHAMMFSYTALIKDKEIIAAEVMNEYNEGFVYPRINPIRRDVAVMTHQSEVVNVWED